MSDRGVDSAVEKILADPEYAKEVLANPERALTGKFDLEPGEWRSIHWSLKQDVEDSLGDVAGYAAAPVNFGRVRFNYVTQLPAFKGSIDRASGDPTSHGRSLR